MYCRNCGGNTLVKKEDYYHCRECGSRALTVTENRKIEEEMRLIADEQKQERVQNLRRQLYERVHARYVNSTVIRGICHELRNELPDDFCARFYEVANGEDEWAYAEFLRGIDVVEELPFIKEVVTFTLRSLAAGLVLPLKNLVENAYKSTDLALYSELTSQIEEEARRVDDCVYDAYIPRDVFVLYSSQDMAQVMELVDALESGGLTCFVAMRNLRQGSGAVENYQKLLETAMRVCRTYVFVSSVHSRNHQCDAFRVEMPYVERIDPQRQKARIEYRIDNKRGAAITDNVVKRFFDGKQYCTDLTQVYERVREHLYDEPDGVCPVCGETVPRKAKFCLHCGASQSNNEPPEKPVETKPVETKPVETKPVETKPVETKPVETAPIEEKPAESKVDAEAFVNEAIANFELKITAEDGDAAAQVMLGEFYRMGAYGFEKNPAEAEKWFRKAAEQGNALAKLHLQSLSDTQKEEETQKTEPTPKAEPTPKTEPTEPSAPAPLSREKAEPKVDAQALWNEVIADFELKIAAEDGDAAAQDMLGEFYRMGVYGFEKNPAEAEKWFRKAAEQGNALAKLHLQSLSDTQKEEETQKTEPTPKAEPTPKTEPTEPSAPAPLSREKAEELCKEAMVDFDAERYEQAVEKWQIAADMGYAEAQYRLGVYYALGTGVVKGRFASSIYNYVEASRKSADAQAKAVSLFTKAAEQGHAKAQYSLAMQYKLGEGVEKNHEEAAKWIGKAAESGLAEAQYDIGNDYEHGDFGRKKSIAQALKWYRSAANQGHAEALFCLGECYQEGNGVAENQNVALKWYRKAAEQGHEEAPGILTSYYGTEMDDDEYKKWDLLSKKISDADKLWSQGLKDVEQARYAQALEKLYVAAEAGNPHAKRLIGVCYESGLGVKKDLHTALKWYLSSEDLTGKKPIPEKPILSEKPAPATLSREAQESLYEEAMRHARNKDYAKAYEKLLIAAEAGHAKAQCSLAECLENARGVKKNLRDALTWYQKAAEQNLVDAQYRLGDLFFFGDDEDEDLPLNRSEGLKWYRKAAEAGQVDAQYQLGLCYSAGDGVKQSDAEAAGWFRKAADAGHADAQYQLGLHYALGDGVKKDFSEALKWYRKAADNGNKDALETLGRHYYTGRGVEKDFAQAMHWYQKAADCGSDEAMYQIGNIYCFGDGVTANRAEAEKWYRKAAAVGHTEAKCLLIACFGDKPEKPYPKSALTLLRLSAEKGDAWAQLTYGSLFQHGMGVEQNPAEAMRWYHKAVQGGSTWAQYALAVCYETGLVTPRGKPDVDTARIWLQEAVQKGNRHAAQRLETKPYRRKKGLFGLFG